MEEDHPPVGSVPMGGGSHNFGRSGENTNLDDKALERKCDHRAPCRAAGDLALHSNTASLRNGQRTGRTSVVENVEG